MTFPTNRGNKSASSSKIALPILLLLFLAVIAALFIFNPFTRSFSDSPRAAKKAAEAVVTLNLYDANGILLGTADGFAALDKDILITNYSCLVGNVCSIEAQQKDGSAFPIDSIVTYDKEHDIAILRAPDCKLKPLKSNTIDSFLNISIKQAQALYDNRTPETEVTVADWYAQSEHSYTAEYILAHGSQLHGQTITTCGMISAIDTGLYLVSSPEYAIYVDARDCFDLSASVMLRDLTKGGHTLFIDTNRNAISTKTLSPGDHITVEGTVMAYSSTDIQLIAKRITPSE